MWYIGGMTEPLTPQQVNDILFASEILVGGQFIGYARDLKIDIAGITPLTPDQARRALEELQAEYRKQFPYGSHTITGTFHADPPD